MDAKIEKRVTIAAVLIGYPKRLSYLCWVDGQSLKLIINHLLTVKRCAGDRNRLNDWKIKSTSDFGNIVFGLAEPGFTGKTESHSIDDFGGVYEFESQFSEPKYAVSTSKFQWSRWTLSFVKYRLTTYNHDEFDRKLENI